jgi:hypothetical protein
MPKKKNVNMVNTSILAEFLQINLYCIQITKHTSYVKQKTIIVSISLRCSVWMLHFPSNW